MSFRSLRQGRVRPGAPLVAVAAVAVAALVASGCGSTVASSIRANAITVDGTSVSRSDFQRDISALSSNKSLLALDKSVAAQGSSKNRLFDSAGKATRVLTTSWLNRLANQIIVDREFKRLKLKITEPDRSEAASQFAALFSTTSANGTDLVKKFPKWFLDQENAREARLVALTRHLDAQHPVTTPEMLKFYNKNVGSLCPSGINVAHVLVKTLKEAQTVESQLAAGADFATLAKTVSTDTGSATQGGSLGCFATGQYVAEFEQATLKAKVGVPTAPVKTQFGYHVILTTKYVPPTFPSVETQIRAEILKEANYLAKFVSSSLKKAKVTVDPSYGTWSKTERKVLAPKVPTVRNSRNQPTTPTS
jgi:parvulin-like peptidyl-prolyl isomerase